MKTRTQRTPYGSDSLWALVLAGGFGRRLESITRALYGKPVPKQFCRLGGSRSLLQDTVGRLGPRVPLERTVVVADASLAHLARQQVGTRGASVIGQPSDRGTAPGVLLPLMHILLEDPEATVVVTPSDHAIADEVCFQEGVGLVAGVVEREEDQIVLFGVEADTPRTDYGWIVPGESLGYGHNGTLRRVKRFTEKPRLERARALLASGALWNTFVMVGKGKTFLDLYRRRLPEIARFFDTFARMDADRRGAWLATNYHEVPRASFSRDLLQTAPNLSVYTWPASLAWTDVGTPDRLFEWLDTRGQMDWLVDQLRRRGAYDVIEDHADLASVAAAV
jgi:mannose-1-phosphate guanylyltransferase